MPEKSHSKSKGTLTTAGAVFYTVQTLLLTDIILYGCLAPLIGVYLAGCCTKFLDLSAKLELVLAVVFTYAVLQVTFWVFVGEYPFWKHLLAMDPFFKKLLFIRDATNIAILLLLVVWISSTVDLMIENHGMKAKYVGEGAGYVFIKTILQWVSVGNTEVTDLLGILRPEAVSSSSNPTNVNMKAQYENGAVYMLLWGMLASCLAKFGYFNTLFTMYRGIELFASMNPSFVDSEDEDNDFDEALVDHQLADRHKKPKKEDDLITLNTHYYTELTHDVR